MSGSVAGKVAYPPYLEMLHSHILYANDPQEPAIGCGAAWTTINMTSLLTTALGATNPYTAATAYDPTTELDKLNTDITDIEGKVTAHLPAGSYWEGFKDRVLGSIDDFIPSTADIDAAVAAYEAKTLPNLAASYNRIAAMAYDIGAVTSTAYPAMLALLENEWMRESADYRAQIGIENDRLRSEILVTSANAIMTYDMQILQTRVQAAQLQATATELSINAEVNEKNQDLEYDANAVKWDLSLLQEGASFLGATAGVPGMNRGLSKDQEQLMMLSTAASLGLGALGAITPLLGMGMMMLSDERLKDNIQPIEGALDKICRLKGKSYVYKDSNIEQTGFIAQEMEEVFPEWVMEIHGYKVIKMSFVDFISVFAHLVEAIKELRDRVEAVEARLQNVKERPNGEQK